MRERRAAHLADADLNLAAEAGRPDPHLLLRFAMAWKDTTPGKLCSSNSMAHRPHCLTFTRPAIVTGQREASPRLTHAPLTGLGWGRGTQKISSEANLFIGSSMLHDVEDINPTHQSFR